MAQRDYYEVLGLSRSATDDEIKRAYRKLAQQYHPDKGGDQEKFKEVNQAYQVLSDKNKRTTYDQFGHAGAGSGGFGGPGGFQGGFGGFDTSGFNVEFENMGGLGDIFDVFFGGGRSSTKPKPKDGRDLELRTKISFKDAVMGANQEITFDRIEICDICKGSTVEPGHSLRTCLTCQGTGQFKEIKQTFLGTVSQASICPTCKGKGQIPEKFCKRCSGAGLVKNRATLKVKIPAGIKSGASIRLRGEGDAAEPGGRTGDLYLYIVVEEHEKFMRDGDDIRDNLEIDFVDAALGSEREVETIDGREKIKIKPGTQTGDEVAIRGKGFPNLDTVRKGDHIVQIKVIVPKHLSRKQKQLLEEFKSEE